MVLTEIEKVRICETEMILRDLSHSGKCDQVIALVALPFII